MMKQAVLETFAASQLKVVDVAAFVYFKIDGAGHEQRGVKIKQIFYPICVNVSCEKFVSFFPDKKQVTAPSMTVWKCC